VLFRLTGLRDLVAVAGRGNLLSALSGLVVGALGVLIASVIVTAAVAAALDELDAGRPVTAARAGRSSTCSRSRWPRRRSRCSTSISSRALRAPAR
jgi:hypothetical protein